ncbi:HmuY family protein [Constantimarinum furrinae]|uniref:HmuY protein n=1 Tax=Constantimarinum furrinae TaxID=2562285 RepID=A0A7G8PXT2_9FLAO|nr:HmuY family protein [Constantimarinum furrinae]QNJ99148.1 hypothetical protein ALE3EI_2619 [Constantimarinum furrinae]
MKTINYFLSIILFAGFSSCSSDDDNNTTLLEVESELVSNLYAPQEGGQGQPVSGAFTKFDFESGQVTTSDTEWDIAFRGTSIIVNGGVSLGTTDEPDRTGEAAAYIANGTMSSVTEVNTVSFVQDSASGYAIPSGSGNGWYLYDSDNFLIVPISGKILVFRTRDGRYAKMEILSYYKDAPSNPDAMVDEGRFYTFNYVFQPNEDQLTF